MSAWLDADACPWESDIVRPGNLLVAGSIRSITQLIARANQHVSKC